MRSQEELGITIAQLRQHRGMSVARLAGLADLVPTTVYRTEAGTAPDYGTLCKIAGALGVMVGDIVDDGAPPRVKLPYHKGVEELAADEDLCYRHRIGKRELDALRTIPQELPITCKCTAHLLLMALRMDAHRGYPDKPVSGKKTSARP